MLLGFRLNITQWAKKMADYKTTVRYKRKRQGFIAMATKMLNDIFGFIT